jgi:hypothetical protein
VSAAAYDLAYYIANTLGQGTLGSGVKCNTMTETPDAQIAVYDYGGARSVQGMGGPDPAALEQRNCQVVVRHTNPSTASGTTETIFRALDGALDKTINGVEYTWMRAMQPPFLLARDAAERVSFAFNLEIERRRA